MLALGNASLFPDRDAQIAVSRQPEEVSADVAELTRSWSRKLIHLIRRDVRQQTVRIGVELEHIRRALIAAGDSSDDAAERVIVRV